MSIDAALVLLTEAEHLRAERFPDLYFRGLLSNRPLRLDDVGRPARWIRIAVAANTPVELESVSVLDLDAGPEKAPVRPVTLVASSLMPGFEPKVQAMDLFDAPKGALAIATEAGATEWVAFELPRTLHRFALTIYARDDRWTVRAWSARVDVSTDGQVWECIYSHSERLAAYLQALESVLASPAGDIPSDQAKRTVGKILTVIIQGNYEAARPLLDKSTISEPDRRNVKSVLNGGLLRHLHREWTSHGIQRSFRYWSPQEKSEYLRCAKEVVTDLKPYSQNVCFGFGFVLGTLRDGDFIPHDDDIDLVLAVAHKQGMRLALLLAGVSKHLTGLGYIVAGNHFNHIHVRRSGWVHVFDVFVGFIEGDRVSWFPSLRKGLLVADVFPARVVKTHGVDCDFPASPQRYLSTTYGPHWKEPDSHFMHPWDRGQYKDLA